MNLLSKRRLSSIIFPPIFIASVTLLIPSSTMAYRCRACPDLTPCEAYGLAELVFIGKAISGDEIRWEGRNKGGKRIQLVGKVRFTVEQAFKGVYGNEVEIMAGDRECEFQSFIKGERYLLYLNIYYNDGLLADICSRSAPI